MAIVALNGPGAFQAVAIGAILFPPNHCFPESHQAEAKEATLPLHKSFQLRVF